MFFRNLKNLRIALLFKVFLMKLKAIVKIYDLKDSLFLFDNIKLNGKYLIAGLHSKIIINSNCEAIFFNNKNLYLNVTGRSNITFIGRLDINNFRGKSKIQIIIEDFDLN